MTVLDVTFGASLIGVMLNVLLYGVMLVQCLEYYYKCERDPKWLKIFIAFLLVADTVNTALNIASIYTFLVTFFGRPNNVPTWYQSSDPATSSIIAGAVQIFFAHRVKRLTGSWALGLIILVLAIVQTLTGIGTSIATGIIADLLHLQKMKAIVCAWLGSAVVTDLFIMTSLVLHLRKSRTGFAVTDDLLSKIIYTTIQTGVFTTFVAALDLILFLSMDNSIHVIFNFPLCKLYSNQLISSLNARSRWEAESARSRPQVASTMGRDRGNLTGIHVTSQVDYTTDVERAKFDRVGLDPISEMDNSYRLGTIRSPPGEHVARVNLASSQYPPVLRIDRDQKSDSFNSFNS